MTADEPLWVSDDIAHAIHDRQLAEHGGSTGVRDAALLASALAKPRNLYAYGDPKPDLAALAASYSFGIARNHPFVDGNKRTALVIGQLFLRLNGYKVDATQAVKAHTFMALAASRLAEDGLADWYRTRLVPV